MKGSIIWRSGKAKKAGGIGTHVTAITKRRFVMAVTCVPMPPLFLALPLRQMMLPLIGPLPVNSQILAITIIT